MQFFHQFGFDTGIGNDFMRLAGSQNMETCFCKQIGYLNDFRLVFAVDGNQYRSLERKFRLRRLLRLEESFSVISGKTEDFAG